MNKQPIEAANDADLRLSQRAMQRAAQRAREMALKTGTAIIVSRQGVIEQIRPSATDSIQSRGVQEPPAPYGGKP